MSSDDAVKNIQPFGNKSKPVFNRARRSVGSGSGTETIEPISERCDSLDFMSENLSTQRDVMSEDREIRRSEQMNQVERNKWFHETMNYFSSIVVQPKGRNLDRSCKLEMPVFYLRLMPVKEQYKQALKKIQEVTNPELVKKGKPEQSIANMMLSSNGDILQLQKQMT